MVNKNIIDLLFDDTMRKEVINFSNRINQINVDVIILMARKAACFVNLLSEIEYVVLDNGRVVTDRILDTNLDWVKDKTVAIIDDIIVSGTTLYTTINKVLSAGAREVTAYVFGVNTKWYNRNLFEYEKDGIIQSYIQPEYVNFNDAECMRICSTIVTCFSATAQPYSVDFPRYSTMKISKTEFERVNTYYDWTTYDVSNQVDSECNVELITVIPSDSIIERFSQSVGFDVSRYCYCKIRLFAKHYFKNKESYHVNAVPYIIFNEIGQMDIELLYNAIFSSAKTGLNISAKIRLLQYVLSAKFFRYWTEICTVRLNCKFSTHLDMHQFSTIFPYSIFETVEGLVNSNLMLVAEISNFQNAPKVDLDYSKEKSKLRIYGSNTIATIQARLVEPFTNLYLNKEIRSREIVFNEGKDAFSNKEYNAVIGRLNIGYSYNFLKSIISDCEGKYNIDHIVSTFIDKAVDAGVIVPIIAEKNGTFFRAYRHGEDVPFGEKEEKLCAVVLDEYRRNGGQNALSELRIEKMLVLLLRIGLHCGIFSQFASNTENEETLNLDKRENPTNLSLPETSMDISSFLHGNVVTLRPINNDGTTTRKHYLTKRNEATWLSDVLKYKGILLTDPLTQETLVFDNINILVEPKKLAQVSQIGKVFGLLRSNNTQSKIPRATNNDLILLSTCLLPRDIVGALAAEIAIFCNAWTEINKTNNDFESIAKCCQTENITVCIDSGYHKFIEFYNRIPQKRITEIRDQFGALDSPMNIYKDVWVQFWPSNINWTEKSINPDLFNLIIREGKWNAITCVLMRILYVVTDGSRSNATILDQLIDVKNKLTVFDKFSDAIDFVKYTDSLIIDYKSNTIDIAAVRNGVIKQINRYVRYSGDVLDDCELIINRFGKINDIRRYSEALFVNSKVGIRDILFNDLIDICVNLIQSNYGGALNISTIQECDNKVTFGKWVIFGGKDAWKAVIDFRAAIMIYDSTSIVMNTIAFLMIPNEFKIKTISKCNSIFKYGYFWEYISYFTQLFATGNIHTIDKMQIRNQIVYTNKSDGTDPVFEYSKEKLGCYYQNITCVGLKFPEKCQIDSQDYKVISLVSKCRKERKPSKSERNLNSAQQAINCVDVLILLAAEDEEKAIDKFEKWEKKQTSKLFDYFYKVENGVSFAYARSINQGESDAGIMGQHMIEHLTPKAVVFVGFCAGNFGKVNLGDVVIAKKVYDYELGKVTDDTLSKEISSFIIRDLWKQEVERFGEEWRGSILACPPRDFNLQELELLHSLQSNPEGMLVSNLYSIDKYPNWTLIINKNMKLRFISFVGNRRIKLTEKGKKHIDEYDCIHPESYSAPIPKTKTGVLATGKNVQAWSNIFKYLENEYDRKTCILDMEGHVLGKLSNFNLIPVLVVKGVGDFANDNKAFDNTWIEYATHSAFRFAIAFFSSEKVKNDLSI